jgi:hypothetical protein
MSSNPITVNGHPFHIKRHLEKALNQLRSLESDRIIWVDAIYINQLPEAVGEKACRIEQMRLVYAEAAQMIAWLGCTDEDSKMVMELLSQFEGE